MATITNQEEMQVLNDFLPFLIRKGKLSLSNIHREFVISPRCKKADGSVDEDKARKLTGELVMKGVYRVLAEYLVESNLAKYYDSPITDEIVITAKGEYLSAHGNLDKFNAAIATQLTQSEVEERTALLIQNIYPFSEFTLTPSKRQPVPEIGGVELNDLISAIENRQQLMRDIIIKEHLEFVKDERVAEYLVHYGFAVNRLDISDTDKLFRQLTDKGRKLKELGSVAAYKRWEQDEKEKDEIRQKLSDRLLTSSLDATIIQNRLLVANRWIAIAGIVAALYYSLEIQMEVKKQHPYFYSRVFPFLLTFELALISLGLVLLLWYILKNTSKDNKKQ